MRLRQRFLPRTAIDIGCFLLIFIFVPVTYVFELIVVLPGFHDTGGFCYLITWILGSFLMCNIMGNMLACMMVDTSIKSELLTPPAQPSLRQYWHFCTECETLVPPRSWHCKVCNTCILRRDHHCVFTGVCVGHRNHRYFFFFMAYIAIGSGYATVYNSLYLWWLHADTYLNTWTAVKVIFPMLMFSMYASWQNLYLVIYVLNIIAFAYSIILLVYHLPMLLKGAVHYERNAPKYNLGWKRNLEMVFGKRMHLVWILPFIKSDLPHDGVHWETLLHNSEKNR